jgi:hypothetical protein
MPHSSEHVLEERQGAMIIFEEKKDVINVQEVIITFSNSAYRRFQFGEYITVPQVFTPESEITPQRSIEQLTGSRDGEN